MTASISFSGTRTTTPTAARSPSAHARSASVAARPAQMAEAPSPTRAGVLGMARTTGVPAPTAASRLAVETPAAIDSTRRVPARWASARAATTSPGLVAATTSAAGAGVSRTATPGNRAVSSARRSATTSTTATSGAVTDPDARRPPNRASHMRPPPRNCNVYTGWRLPAARHHRSDTGPGRGGRNPGGDGWGSGRFPDGRAPVPTLTVRIAPGAVSGDRSPEPAQPLKREPNPRRMAGRKHCSTAA